MKKILIDIYKIKDMYSGLGQFSMNFAQELLNQLPNELHVDFLVPDIGHSPLGSENCTLTKANFQKRYFPSLNKDYALWHSLHQFPAHFPNKKTKQVLTIHDLNFLIEKSDLKKKKYLDRLQKNVDRAHHITTISNYSKKQIEKNLDLKGKKVDVIYNGVSSLQKPIEGKPKYIQKDKYFFSIGAFNKRKNFHALVPLMKKFKDHQLIIAGDKNSTYGKEIEKQIDLMGLKDQVVLPGKISDNERSWLYENCSAFLFPSIAEGFGLPVIEAMNYGKPVFLSTHTSLPEIGGEAAFYFDNFEEEHMCNIIRGNMKRVANDPKDFEVNTRIYAEKFNWKNCIKQYLDLYQKLI